ncbi:NAD-dependent protein deacylase [Psychromonas sp. MB-3u-54]|uniref:Sir2 family NAD+-dependent deacetylase n=1 Tax=Psychromonas sp. MB-3u-54 TaxID=2058319 RepID=UPI000C321742|nr:Sir2 family NAD+-dependent deacetylase [Psychromonas sp. MB-3u-54]PKH03203.1 NAD-dependent protein deacylase [Psychromonas sp. MB-3u-54]
MSFHQYKKIVVLTGAGVSAESGIQTFRDTDGLWENHKLEDVATVEGYQKDPELVLDFYNQRRRDFCSGHKKPNAAHFALAELEEKFDGEFLLVTQNIDNLHEQAGSKNIIHMHGELLKSRCPTSNQLVECYNDISTSDFCHCCQYPSTLRPHIVWFGEMPLGLDIIYHHLSQADLFIAIGTSGTVYPAAGFVEEAKSVGAFSIELNLEASEIHSHFDQVICGKATSVVPDLVNAILESQPTEDTEASASKA